ncbi:hypothetical protein [Ignavibacterium album]|uniref:hypothetical protein n=1 Tax=Ignavibacterium album TaxID=591197 RepID=UPI0026F02861|nr:hypothetical protein [Ignavibacterium album]
MNAGDVIYFVNFEFSNGSKKDKLIIILNNPKSGEPYLVCITTSQHKVWRSKQPGCHSENNYYFIESGHSEFKKDTWIVFDRVYEIPVDKILNSCIRDGSYSLFSLESSLWKAIKNCITKSKDIEQDYIEMILR